MSETPMNKLRELVERWRSESGGDLPTSIREVVTELDPIVSDVERLETEVANLKAHREKFEKTNGELTDYAYLCKLEGQVERLVEAAQMHAKKGHNDTCSLALCGDHYQCDCGYAIAVAALAASAQPVAPKETK